MKNANSKSNTCKQSGDAKRKYLYRHCDTYTSLFSLSNYLISFSALKMPSCASTSVSSRMDYPEININPEKDVNVPSPLIEQEQVLLLLDHIATILAEEYVKTFTKSGGVQ